MASDYRNDTTDNLPRGIRNNNPGNIRDDGTAWQGKAGADGDGFLIFTDMSWGTRALGKDLLSKIQKGENTIASIIAVYAPTSDNNDVAAYVEAVSADTGIDATTVLGTDPTTLASLIRAFANHENGSGPSEQYISDQDIADGISLINNPVLSSVQAAVVLGQQNPLQALFLVAVAGFLLYEFSSDRRS
jgi:hypothetical protein